MYTVTGQELVSLYNGLKTLKSELIGDECAVEIHQGRDFGLSIFCEVPPTGLCRDFLPVLPDYDIVVFRTTVGNDGLCVSNKAASKTKALFARKLLAVKDTGQGKDSPMTLLPPWMTSMASPLISQFPKLAFWFQEDLLTQKLDGMYEPEQTTVELNDAEARTSTLLAFTGSPYNPMNPAETGESSSKEHAKGKAPSKENAKRASPRPGSPDAVSSSTGDGIPQDGKKTAKAKLSTIDEEKSRGENDDSGYEEGSVDEHSDSDLDGDTSGSDSEAGKEQSGSESSRSSSSESDSSSSSPMDTDEVKRLLHNTEKSEAEAPKRTEHPPLQLVLSHPTHASSSAVKEATVTYGDIEVLTGSEGVVIVDCNTASGSSNQDARMQAELEEKQGTL